MMHHEVVLKLGLGEHPIDLSIQKWDAIIRRRGVDEGNWNCACCITYQESDGCPKCPIFLYVGEVLGKDGRYCDNTPYEEYEDANHGRCGCVDPHCDCQMETARKMKQFLEEVKEWMLKTGRMPP